MSTHGAAIPIVLPKFMCGERVPSRVVPPTTKKLQEGATDRIMACIHEIATVYAVDVSVVVVVLAVERLPLVLPDVRFQVRVRVDHSGIE